MTVNMQQWNYNHFQCQQSKSGMKHFKNVETIEISPNGGPWPGEACCFIQKLSHKPAMCLRTVVD